MMSMGMEKKPPETFADLKSRNYTLYSPQLQIDLADYVKLHEHHLQTLIPLKDR